MRQAFQFMLAPALLWFAAAPIAHAQNAGDPTVYVVRYIEVMPGAQDQAAGLIKKLADTSREEAGAVRFDVLQRAAPANQFATFENWKDQASLDAHGAAAHKQFLAAAQPLLIAPVDDRLCVAIDTAPPPAGGEGAIYAITHVDVAPPNREAGIALLKGVAGRSARRMATSPSMPCSSRRAPTISRSSRSGRIRRPKTLTRSKLRPRIIAPRFSRCSAPTTIGAGTRRCSLEAGGRE